MGSVVLVSSAHDYWLNSVKVGLSPLIGLLLFFIYLGVLIVVASVMFLTPKNDVVPLHVLIFTGIALLSGVLIVLTEAPIFAINGRFSLYVILTFEGFYLTLVAFYRAKNNLLNKY